MCVVFSEVCSRSIHRREDSMKCGRGNLYGLKLRIMEMSRLDFELCIVGSLRCVVRAN